MRRAALTVGPQGAGKTTFCKTLLAQSADIAFISRDDFLTARYGNAAFDPYSGAFEMGMPIFWDNVQVLIQEHEMTIVDAWNGDDRERRSIASKLQNYGAEVVEAWHFVTPIELCAERFARRAMQERESKREFMFKYASGKRNAQTFYSLFGNLHGTFNVVRCIDDRQGVLFPYSVLLRL